MALEETKPLINSTTTTIIASNMTEDFIGNNEFGQSSQRPGLFTTFVIAYTGIIIMVGTIGNVWCIQAVLRPKATFLKSASRQFLVAVCAADLCAIFSIAITWLDRVFSIGLANMPAVCKVSNFCGYLAPFLCSYFIVQLTFTRFHAVRHPIKHRIVITRKRGQMVIIATTVIALIYNSWYFISVRIMNGKCNLDPRYVLTLRVFDVLAIIVVFSIPFALLVGLDSWLALLLVTRFKSAPPEYPDNIPEIGTALQQRRQSVIATHARRAKDRLEYRLAASSVQIQKTHKGRSSAKRLLVASVVYLALNLPSYIIRLCAQFSLQPPQKVTTIAYLLLTTQYSINCFTYTASFLFNTARISKRLQTFLRSNKTRECNDEIKSLRGSPSPLQEHYV